MATGKYPHKSLSNRNCLIQINEAISGSSRRLLERVGAPFSLGAAGDEFHSGSLVSLLHADEFGFENAREDQCPGGAEVMKNPLLFGDQKI